jgi:hypothetical protein
MAAWYTRHVDEYFADRQGGLEKLMRDNAFALVPRLRHRDQKDVGDA